MEQKHKLSDRLLAVLGWLLGVLFFCAPLAPGSWTWKKHLLVCAVFFVACLGAIMGYGYFSL